MGKNSAREGFGQELFRSHTLNDLPKIRKHKNGGSNIRHH
jgi:hypothetical protein